MSTILDSLVAGRVYFIVMFEDAQLTIPVIQTLIYEGEMFREDGSKYLAFQELKPNGERSNFIVDTSHREDLVLTADGLIETLRTAFSGRLPTIARNT